MAVVFDHQFELLCKLEILYPLQLRLISGQRRDASPISDYRIGFRLVAAPKKKIRVKVFMCELKVAKFLLLDTENS